MRAARARYYLMRRPTHFDVACSINPWMDPAMPVESPPATAQWERLREVFPHLGHTVDTIDPNPVSLTWSSRPTAPRSSTAGPSWARFRDAEGPAYQAWLRDNGFRSGPRSRYEAGEHFGRPVVGLTLVTPTTTTWTPP